MRLEDIKLDELYNNKKIDTIIEYYKLNYDLSIAMIDLSLNADKLDYINTNLTIYNNNAKFKEIIDNYDILGPVETKNVLGKYYDNVIKPLKRKNYIANKRQILDMRLEDLKAGKLENIKDTITGCFIDDKLVGIVEYSITDTIHINKIYSKNKNEGVGTELLKYVVKKGYDISLDVLYNNPAKKLYERNGFTYELDKNGNPSIKDNNFLMTRKK